MKKLQERMHFANFFIAGFNYYDSCMAWEEFKVGAIYASVFFLQVPSFHSVTSS